MRRRASSHGRPGALAAAIVATSCLDPTQATVTIATNVPCGDEAPTAGALLEVGVLAGGQTDVVTGELQGTTRRCTPGDGTHRVGDVVVYPIDGADEARLLVVAGIDDASAEACLEAARGDPAAFPASCIVARRRLSFVGQTDLQVPVLLDAACAGVVCEDDSTCARRGVATSCVSAEVACRDGACTIDGEGGAGATSSTSSTGAGGAGGDGTGGGGGGAAGGGGGDAFVVETVPVEGQVLRVAGMTGAAGEAGDLFVVTQGADGQSVLRLDPATPIEVPLDGEVVALDARHYTPQGEQVVLLTPDTVFLVPELEEEVDPSTDATLLRGDRVLVANGSSELLRVSTTQIDVTTLDLPATVVDTYDGVIAVAAGDGVCWTTPDRNLCVDLESVDEPVVSVAAGPLGTGGLAALAVTAGGVVALVSFTRQLSGELETSTQLLTPPAAGVAWTGARVTVSGQEVDGLWVAGSRDGAAFLARGVREGADVVWTVVDALSGEAPLVDLWVAASDGDRAWVVTEDGRLLAIQR